MVVFAAALGLPCLASLGATTSLVTVPLAVVASLALLIRMPATGQQADYLIQGCRKGPQQVRAMLAFVKVKLELMASATVVPLFLVLVKKLELLHFAQCRYE